LHPTGVEKKQHRWLFVLFFFNIPPDSAIWNDLQGFILNLIVKALAKTRIWGGLVLVRHLLF
jgi:hypothetical protein